MAACPADLDAESATLSDDISIAHLPKSESLTSQTESREGNGLNPPASLQKTQDKLPNQAPLSVTDLSDSEFKELLDDCISFRGVSGSGSQPFQKLLQEVGPPDPEPPVSPAYPFQLSKTQKRLNRVRKEPSGPWLAFVKENSQKNRSIAKSSGISSSAAAHAKQGGSLQNLSSSEVSVGRRRRRREGSGGGGAGNLKEGSRKREGGSLPCDGERERLVEEIEPNLKLDLLDSKIAAKPPRKGAPSPSSSPSIAFTTALASPTTSKENPPKYPEIELQVLKASASSAKGKTSGCGTDGWCGSSYGTIEPPPSSSSCGLDGEAAQCVEEHARVQQLYQDYTIVQIDRDGELSECNVIRGLSREDSEDRHTEEMDVDCSDQEGKDEATALLGGASKAKMYQNFTSQRKDDVDSGVHFGSLNPRRESYTVSNGTSLEEGGAGKRPRGRQGRYSSLDENGNPASFYETPVGVGVPNSLSISTGLARNSLVSSNKVGSVYSTATSPNFTPNSTGQSTYEKKKQKREKTKPKGENMLSEAVPGYRGNQEVEDLLEFIESSDQSKKHSMPESKKGLKKDALSRVTTNAKSKGQKRLENGVNHNGGHREGRGSEKNVDRIEDSKEQRKNKARSQDGRQGRASTSECSTASRVNNKVPQRSSSLENVSLRPSCSSQSSESLNGTSPDLILTSPRNEPPTSNSSSYTSSSSVAGANSQRPYQPSHSLAADTTAGRQAPSLASPRHDKSFEEPDFQTVTKRQRRKKHQKPSAGIWSSGKAGAVFSKEQRQSLAEASLAPSAQTFNRFTSPRSKVRNLSRYSASSVPSSDRSDDDSDADDAQSVHSLPACPSGPSTAPQSYADIARVAKNVVPSPAAQVVLAYSVVTPSHKGGGGGAGGAAANGNGGKGKDADEKNPPLSPSTTIEDSSKVDFPPLKLPQSSTTNANSHKQPSPPPPASPAALTVVVASPTVSPARDCDKDKDEKKGPMLDADYPSLEDTVGRPRDRTTGAPLGPTPVTQVPPIGDWSRPLPLPRRIEPELPTPQPQQQQQPLPFFHTTASPQNVTLPPPPGAALSPRLPPPMSPQGILLSPGAVPPNVLLRPNIMLPTTVPYMVAPPHVVMPMPLLMPPGVPPPPQSAPPSFLGPSLVMETPPPPMHPHTVPLGVVMNLVVPSSVSVIPPARKTSLTTTAPTSKRGAATSLSQLGRASSLPPPLPSPNMPAVVMVAETSTPDELEDLGLSFGFEVNEQLLAGSAGLAEVSGPRGGQEVSQPSPEDELPVTEVSSGEKSEDSFESGGGVRENVRQVSSRTMVAGGQNFAALYREVPEPEHVFQRNREIIAFVSQMWNGVARQMQEDSGSSGVKFYTSE